MPTTHAPTSHRTSTPTPTTTATTPSNMTHPAHSLEPLDSFARRHIGPREHELGPMLQTVGFASLDALVDATIPKNIRLAGPMTLSAPADRPRGEAELLAELRAMAQKNKVARSCLGMGYHGTVTPPVILRNILENPGWYTQYTPYQSEISQGRLEALLNFQTMIADLTGLPIAGASLLDEGTAAAEAMTMCTGATQRARFFVASDCHPQTIGVVRTRAESIGVELVVGEPTPGAIDDTIAGVLVQYPTTDGRVECSRGARRGGARQGRAGGRGGGPAGADAADPARRVGRGHRGGFDAAVRRADGVRRPARGVHGVHREAHAAHARAHHRRLQGRRGQAGLPHGDPDPRAAHQA